MRLDNVELLQLLCKRLQRDPSAQRMASALQPEFRGLAVSVPLLLLYERIDPPAGSGKIPLDEEQLDELAWQMHVDFYDVGADVGVKRQLVKSAIRIHRLKGTPAAVEEAMAIAFTAATLEEWFDYDGDPFTFRISTDARISSLADLDRFLKALRMAKRASSHLTEIIVNGAASINQHVRLELMLSPLYELDIEPLTMTWSQWNARNLSWAAIDALDLYRTLYFKPSA